ncbi:MAG: SDR family NAD(P)-dependent oxidoreductase, partial [Chitinispirillaceae bacterium]|nr:SDR family NAD(P)-dependent oxidoreductase [Chitinispirillaceae bacterium]
MKLRGKTALVTGAARRIGRAIALSLANQGVDIIVHCNKSVKEARLLCREIQQKGVASWLLRADLADSDDLCSVVPIALESAKKLDIIINNASVFTESTLTDLTREDFMKNIDTNAWAPLLISRDFYRLSGRGSIINILDSRIAGFDQAHVGYIFSKHMLAEMTRYMAMAFAPEITVNAVAPGLILQPQGKTSA